MAGGNDNAATRLFPADSHFDGGSCRQAQVYHIETKAKQGLHHQGADHLAADTAITADDDQGAGILFFQPAAIGGCKLNDVRGSEILARCSSDGSTDAGNTIYQCHILLLPTL